ncbi:hypothetical protein EVAR_54055_1 [Eumeta japonica]|uniref:Uncharacterized protein n=1 Tax=Eumeta variegata TaxID=151549 RepID=A0A4C1XG02_EUMVA|nr:hypothetical protein EVAR_54055_1 [Eumeta japonica]
MDGGDRLLSDCSPVQRWFRAPEVTSRRRPRTVAAVVTTAVDDTGPTTICNKIVVKPAVFRYEGRTKSDTQTHARTNTREHTTHTHTHTHERHV